MQQYLSTKLEEDTASNTEMSNLLQSTLSSKKPVVGRMLLHNCFVNFKKPTITFKVSSDKLKTDRI